MSALQARLEKETLTPEEQAVRLRLTIFDLHCFFPCAQLFFRIQSIRETIQSLKALTPCSVFQSNTPFYLVASPDMHRHPHFLSLDKEVRRIWVDVGFVKGYFDSDAPSRVVRTFSKLPAVQRSQADVNCRSLYCHIPADEQYSGGPEQVAWTCILDCSTGPERRPRNSFGPYSIYVLIV